MTLDISNVDKFVENNPNARWESWDIVLFEPDSAAESSPDGTWHNGQWGYQRRIAVNSDGTWTI